jgi:hypothetical protein
MGETRLAIKPIRMKIKDLSRSFSGFSLRFDSRSCNTVAHASDKQVSREQEMH